MKVKISQMIILFCLKSLTPMVRSSKVPRAMMGLWTWTHTHCSIPWGSLCFPVMILQRVPLKTGSCVPTVWAKKYDHGAVLFMFLLSKSMGVRSHSYKLQAFNIPSPENHVSHNKFRGYHWNRHILNLPSSNVWHNEGSFPPLIYLQMLHVHRCIHPITSHPIPSHPIPSHPPVASDHQGEEHRRDAWRETHQTHGFLVIAVWQDVIMRPVDSRQLIINIYIYTVLESLSWRIIYHFIYKRTDFNKAFSVYTCRAFPPCCFVAISEM